MVGVSLLFEAKECHFMFCDDDYNKTRLYIYIYTYTPPPLPFYTPIRRLKIYPIDGFWCLFCF